MTAENNAVAPSIVKSYDIRGLYGKQFDLPLAYGLGRTLPRVVSAGKAVIGHDARLASPELAAALAAGFHDQGLEVTFLGMCPTECVYFQVGRDANAGLGVMVTDRKSTRLNSSHYS